MKKTLICIFINLLYTLVYSQTNISGIINNYSSVTNINTTSCSTNITISDTSKFRVGTKVMIIQMKGASMNTSNSASYGNLISYNDAGNYEFATIIARSGSIVTVSPALSRTYTISNLVQLVTVPQYSSARVNGLLTCTDWDGTKGGILVFETSGNLQIDSTINTTGKGFKGGRVNPNLLVCVNNNEAGYFYNFTSTVAAEKGEGIYIPAVGYESGKGKNMNGGGGGQCKNGGGGGGANAGRGGLGGKGFNVLSNTSIPSGIGADTVTYNPSINKLFLGGGGGSGHQDDPSPMGRVGADGGGLILIIADSIKGTAMVINDGDSAVTAGTDGAGGGGAGGTTALYVNQISSSILFSNKGGKGGNNNGTNALGIETSGYCVAPGGGGGGGAIWLKHLITISSNISGGLSGIIKATSSPCFNTGFGATNGEIGLIRTGLLIPITIENIIRDSLYFNACNGDTIIYNSTNFYSNSTFNDTINSITSCDTIRTIIINFSNCDTLIYVNRNITICNGDSILIAGIYRYTSSIYYDTILTTSYFDTLYIFHLNTINCDTIGYFASLSRTICNGDSLLIDGIYRYTTGIYYDTINAHTNFDTLITYNLSTFNCDTIGYFTNINQTICNGDSLLIDGIYRHTTGIYYDTINAHTNFDTLITYNLSTLNCDTFKYIISINDTLCIGDSIYIENDFIFVDGIYYDSINAHSINDTLLIHNVSFVSCDSFTYKIIESDTLCIGDSIFISDTYRYVTGIYFDTINTLNNEDSIITKYVFFIDCDSDIVCKILTPTGFTPNNDGMNDLFRTYSNCDITNFSIKIFNRWGEMIFQSNDFNESWDGLYKNRECPIGVYSWLVQVQFKNIDRQNLFKGNVTLIR